MLTIKATIYFAVLLAILLIISNFFHALKNDLSLSLTALTSKLVATNCSLIINSFYSNSGGTLKNFNSKCYLKEKNIVASNIDGIEKTALILNSSTTISQGQNSLNLEVKVREHYEK